MLIFLSIFCFILSIILAAVIGFTICKDEDEGAELMTCLTIIIFICGGVIASAVAYLTDMKKLII